MKSGVRARASSTRRRVPVRGKTLPEQVYRLHSKLIRRINDTHIFVQQAVRLLHDAKQRYVESKDPDDKPYDVPAHGKSGVVKRSDAQLREIYDRYIATDLYSNLLVTIVSLCESFLFEVLRLVLQAHPEKMKINVQGVALNRTVDIDTVLNAMTIKEARLSIIDQRLHAVSYARPTDYLRFLHHAAHITTNDDAFAEYVEIKATRDIIVHSAGIVNSIYTTKVGANGRADAGVRLPMDADYFDHCVATVKRIAVIVKEDIEQHFT